jgi:hypothetical protein
MKSIRTGYIGQADDQYLDHTRYDKDKAPEAGRKSDPKTGGSYTDIKLVNGKPEFMHKSGTPANKGGTYYLKEEDKVPFDDSKFQPGDEVASILVAPTTGDRGDISTNIAWNNGKWSIVLARKLVTGSKYDVQFERHVRVWPRRVRQCPGAPRNPLRCPAAQVRKIATCAVTCWTAARRSRVLVPDCLRAIRAERSVQIGDLLKINLRPAAPLFDPHQ